MINLGPRPASLTHQNCPKRIISKYKRPGRRIKNWLRIAIEQFSCYEGILSKFPRGNTYSIRRKLSGHINAVIWVISAKGAGLSVPNLHDSEFWTANEYLFPARFSSCKWISKPWKHEQSNIIFSCLPDLLIYGF